MTFRGPQGQRLLNWTIETIFPYLFSGAIANFDATIIFGFQSFPFASVFHTQINAAREQWSTRVGVMPVVGDGLDGMKIILCNSRCRKLESIGTVGMPIN
jgi:hypothetical protein